jgi:hypothetical protein
MPKKTAAAKGEKVEKVKRAPSPYILFCSAKRAELIKAHPTATFGELGKLQGEAWKKMDDKAKQVLFLYVLLRSL